MLDIAVMTLSAASTVGQMCAECPRQHHRCGGVSDGPELGRGSVTPI